PMPWSDGPRTLRGVIHHGEKRGADSLPSPSPHPCLEIHMVRSRFLSAGIAGAALVASAASLQAQTANRLGFTMGFGTSYTDRIGGTTIVGDALQHFDNRDYQDWALDPTDTTGSNFTLTGCQFIIQDQVGTTPESFDVVGYTEDPTTPN